MVEIETIDEAAEAAREAAEARRQKILESAQDRMNLVEGTTPSSSSTHTPSSPDAPDVATTDDDPSAVAAPSSSAASRMAAMRRRRFKSKPQDTTTAAAAATSSSKEAADETMGTAPAKKAADKAKDSDDEKEASAPDAAVETQEETKQTKPEEPSEPSVMVTSENPDNDTTAVNAPKKKYQGVAKMRRRMLKEKQHDQEDQQSENAKTGTSNVPAVSKKLAKAQVTGKPPLLPILMHAVTVLLLFLAGLDVGLQQRSIDYYEGALLTVHTELAPRRQLGGMAVIQKWIGSGGTADEGSSASPKLILTDESYEDTATLHDHDEFADVLTDNSKTGATESNIDPLFQVDLDKITQGPGLLLMMGRFAVRVHRLNLAMFWYGPRAFFLGVADWLVSLTTTPPILCLTAIVIRQFVGKAILGAHLPARVEDEKQHKDVMSTIKMFLSNIVLRSFPNAVRLYDIFSHVRADMYILLCGLFVGMAISHSALGGTAALGDLAQPLEESEPPVKEGISDEL